MDKNRPVKNNQEDDISDKKKFKADSDSLNDESEHGPVLGDGIADDHPPKPGTIIKDEPNPKVGNIGKNNAGGYE